MDLERLFEKKMAMFALIPPTKLDLKSFSIIYEKQCKTPLDTVGYYR